MSIWWWERGEVRGGTLVIYPARGRVQSILGRMITV